MVSYFTTVGNYDYGFYWYFYLDGTIECEVKATGVLFTAAHPGGDHPYSTEVAPGLGAPVHQHLFSARLDMTRGRAGQRGRGGRRQRAADRAGQPVRQRDRAAGDPADPRVAGGPPYGRLPRPDLAGHQHRAGEPVRPADRYTLYPEPTPALLADPDSPLAARAGFAANHLWVTRYDPAQRYPAGDFVNQNPGGAGLPAFIAGDRDIDGAGHRGLAHVRPDARRRGPRTGR